MRQKIVPGGEIEALTPLEAAELLSHLYREEVEERVRAAASIQLDANGNGEDDVYTPPIGFEAEVRRVALDLSTSSDPGAGLLLSAGPVLSASGSTAAAPAAFTTIANLGILPKGVYSVAATVWQSGTPDTNLLNGQLAAPNGLTVNLPSLSTPQTTILRVVADGINFTVLRTGAAAGGAGAIYNGVAIATPVGGAGITVEYLRGVGGYRIEWGQPQYGPTLQIPGIQTWGDEQGPYIRNGETFAVRAKGLTANALLVCTVEAIQRRPPAAQESHHAGAAVSSRAFGEGAKHPPRPDRTLT